ncbi:PREDICTED: uncharacterized protein LOC106744613 [Dinoponera quadriceps]|uniref:Uncharacterized protein LOC106744613 n=1 Tax=Dinoponera quadriceps TaxID=609295 RepID=A0A6P3X9P6_DINQU|nr:PREDICTED: uncharacterized protein LOC106744613 [Dinoponera quadriceps]
MQRVRDDIELPCNFDDWTAQEQSDWMYHNMTNLYKNVPESLQNLIPAYTRSLDFNRSLNVLPEWMDPDKYHKGQKFVREHYFSYIMAIILGSIYAYTFEDGLKPIIIGGNSHTPYLAVKRYFSDILYLNTMKRILDWYDGEPWSKGTEAYRDMQIARNKHIRISTKVSLLDNKQYQEDLNNMVMAVAQAHFIMLPVLYPQKVGMHFVTDEDLEAFCHMWKCYGYFLGIEDE